MSSEKALDSRDECDPADGNRWQCRLKRSRGSSIGYGRADPMRTAETLHLGVSCEP